MFQKLQVCNNWDGGQWEWGGRSDGGLGGVDGTHVLKGGEQERSCKDSQKSY